MRDNNILDRSELARGLPGIGLTTVYRNFGADWSGPVTLRMLTALAAKFGVPVAELMSELVVEPGMAEESA